MTDEEFRHRVQFDAAPGSSGCTVRLRDAFLNYAFSDQLKARLQDAFRAQLASGARSFVIDLRAVNVMDSCGLSVLISLRKVCDAQGARLVLIVTSPMLLRLFAITRLDGVFEIVADEPSAAATLGLATVGA